MDKINIIKNYIRDNYNLEPDYYSHWKSYIIEYSWAKYACKEILYNLSILQNTDDDSIMDMLKEMEKEAINCIELSKSMTSEIIFNTELNIIREMEGLI